MITSDGVDDATAAAGVHCVRHWLTAHLLTHATLTSSFSIYHNGMSMSLVDRLCYQTICMGAACPLVCASMADLLDDILVMAHEDTAEQEANSPSDFEMYDNKGNHTKGVSTTNSLFPADYLDACSVSLNGMLSHVDMSMVYAQGGAYVSTQWMYPFTRILAATMKLTLFVSPNPFIDIPSDAIIVSREKPGATALAVMSALCLAANFHRIHVAAIAFEV